MDNIDDDDQNLWQQLASEVVPLKNKKPLMESPPEKEIIIKNKLPNITKITPINSLQSKGNPYDLLQSGDMSRVDGSIARKLKQGNYPIDLTIDLHGKTQNEAFALLQEKIINTHSAGGRCILVITGKGAGGEGVLRSALPKWLDAPEIRQYILSITQANKKHGGSGAFYVLLRKGRL